MEGRGRPLEAAASWSSTCFRFLDDDGGDGLVSSGVAESSLSESVYATRPRAMVGSYKQSMSRVTMNRVGCTMDLLVTAVFMLSEAWHTWKGCSRPTIPYEFGDMIHRRSNRDELLAAAVQGQREDRQHEAANDREAQVVRLVLLAGGSRFSRSQTGDVIHAFVAMGKLDRPDPPAAGHGA